MKKHYLSLDIESGGLDPKKHSLLAVGWCIVTEGLKIVERKEYWLRGLKSRCTPEALKVNGIDLAHHNTRIRSPREIIRSLSYDRKEFFGGQPIRLMGHNVPFDVSFMEEMYRKQGRKFRYHYYTIDTMALMSTLKFLSRSKLKSASLDYCLDYFKIRSPKQDRHSALVDAENVVRLLRVIKKFIDFV